ncbi:MAG: hypothetical protein ABSB35_02300 [Bryobacteraceae bacterium]|jgi:hypothetical protein
MRFGDSSAQRYIWKDWFIPDEGVSEAERLAQDPLLRLIGSEKTLQA